MNWIKRLLDRLKAWFGRQVDAPADKPVEDDLPIAVPVPEQPTSGDWRSDLATLPAHGNAVEFWTRNVEVPSRPNLDGGSEWIIAQINGSGYGRLLLMTMNPEGRRSPSRIFFGAGSSGGMFDGLFPVPLAGPSLWRIEATGGSLRVLLDGREVWARAGAYGVSSVTFNGYDKRGFLGEWAAK